MKRNSSPNRPSARVLQVMVWMALLTLVACKGEVNFSPTAPQFSNIANVGIRTLEISANLVAERGSCLEATILYDGRELPGARTICPKSAGCTELEIAAVTPSVSGHHTISIQLLRQSLEVDDYLVEGTVLVTRAGLTMGGATIGLGPERTSLRSGESVTFDIAFRD